ncbi:hypothetical protein [Erythrobacter sp. SD-21]|uniref:hypothetical protein n=1 Tax=Erythrobacter sp. SD-21 TaxID=161528 RepID=UPI000153F0C4|nr:hypothetical protein [Erythrobacter sp. SD-21]EDL48250.1 hypothetical protein ED21_31904 [Erythrobacter sp. SD-21]
MKIEGFQLPAHHAINRYFREQRENSDHLMDSLCEEPYRTWKAAYQKPRLSSDQVKQLGDSFDATLKASRAFEITRTAKKGTKGLPNREYERVTGFYMEPVTFGEGIHEEGLRPYVENALLLRVARAEFRRKRGFLGIGFSGIALTQHMLSRVYERTGVDHAELGSLINTHVADLMAKLGMAEALGLWTGNAGGRATAIPFANGLLLVNTRLLLGKIRDGDFGFYTRFPKPKSQAPFVNQSLLIDCDKKWREADLQPAITLCGMTYLNLSTLNRDQFDFYFQFEALKADVGQPALAALANHYFSPSLAHERVDTITFSDEQYPKRAKALALLQSGWLTADKPSFAALLSFESVVAKDKRI